MTSATSRTGRNAKAVIDDTLVLRLTEHAVNPTAGENAWGDSDGAGFTNRSSGRRDCTFTFAGKWDSGREIYDMFNDGDIAKVVLWQSTAAGDYWHFARALIISYSLTHNVDAEEVVGWEANGGSDGRFYFPGEAGAPSETLPSS